MSGKFQQQLTGGHPNSLGNTLEVVDEVLKNPSMLEELYQCYFCHDEVVRLRTSNALKRICKQHPLWLQPYIDGFLNDVSLIDQASTQWTLATLFDLLDQHMSDQQKEIALSHLKSNLQHHQDWIVLNTTMDTLGKWALQDSGLRKWMHVHLKRLCNDKRKSVAGKATKTMTKLKLK